MTVPAMVRAVGPLMLREVVRQVDAGGAEGIAQEITDAATSALTAGERQTVGALLRALAARWPE